MLFAQEDPLSKLAFSIDRQDNQQFGERDDMALRRQDYTKDEFTDEFKSTVLFSAIDARSYIDWGEITSQVEQFVDQLANLEQLEDLSDDEFKTELKSLLEGGLGNVPMYQLCFRLLGVGKSKDDFVVREGIWKTGEGATVEVDNYGADHLSKILLQAGIRRIVEGDYDIKSLLTGIEIGLESHARKNRQGEQHEMLLEKELKAICDTLVDAGHQVELVSQYKIDYHKSEGSKTVDFALLELGRPIIVFEANCYSAQGSKPSAIKRSYETVAKKMEKDGVEYVWITDGYAWKSSLGRILDAAFASHPNLYNLKMAHKELGNDILAFMDDDTRELSQNDVDPQSRLTDACFDSS